MSKDLYILRVFASKDVLGFLNENLGCSVKRRSDKEAVVN